MTIMNFDTAVQRFFKRAAWYLAPVALATMAAVEIRAVIICAPQAGKRTPWTGTVCYGEKP